MSSKILAASSARICCLSDIDLTNLGFDDDGDDNDDDDDSAISLLEELSTGIDHTREKLLLPPPENTHTNQKGMDPNLIKDRPLA